MRGAGIGESGRGGASMIVKSREHLSQGDDETSTGEDKASTCSDCNLREAGRVARKD